MKEYVFVRGEEEMRVETDALGKIDNFIVTGVFGTSYSQMVQDGIDLKMGDVCTRAKMTNFAKNTECTLRVYEGSVLIEDECYEPEAAEE